MYINRSTPCPSPSAFPNRTCPYRRELDMDHKTEPITQRTLLPLTRADICQNLSPSSDQCPAIQDDECKCVTSWRQTADRLSALSPRNLHPSPLLLPDQVVRAGHKGEFAAAAHSLWHPHGSAADGRPGASVAATRGACLFCRLAGRGGVRARGQGGSSRSPDFDAGQSCKGLLDLKV
jgi:hypothetical protein